MSVQDSLFGESELAAVGGVLKSGQLWRGNGAEWGGPTGVGGSAVDRFEDAFATWLGLPYILAVNSGSSANEATIASLGLKPGDEVICPAASPIFIPFSVLALGCIPVFADVDSETMLVSPDEIEIKISNRTRAIVVVHLWGQAAPIEAILRVATKYDLKVIEDCAQAFETTIDGRPVGTFGDAACFSLQQSKHITSGEGGVFATRRREDYIRAVLYSNSGIPSFRYGIPAGEAGAFSEGHLCFGHNHRMSELQGAVALAQIKRIRSLSMRRAELVAVARRELEGHAKARAHAPHSDLGVHISYWKYPVRVPTGCGDYKDIPQLHPAFAEIERTRLLPFGSRLPDHVHYDSSECPGAIVGSRRIRLISVHHGQSDEEVRTAARKVITACEDADDRE